MASCACDAPRGRATGAGGARLVMSFARSSLWVSSSSHAGVVDGVGECRSEDARMSDSWCLPNYGFYWLYPHGDDAS